MKEVAGRGADCCGCPAMAWPAWQVVLLLVLLVVVLHRAALHLLHRFALRRMRWRSQRWLRSSVPSAVHDALLPLLPAALLASAYTADVQWCAAQSLRIEWPLSSCLRSVTIHLQQPLLDITLQPADDAEAGAYKAAVPPVRANAAFVSSSRPVVISSLNAVLLRWFRVSIIATDIRCHISTPDVGVEVQVAALRAKVRWSARGDGGMECQLRLNDCAARLKYPSASDQHVVFPSQLLHSKLLSVNAVLPFHHSASLPAASTRLERSSFPVISRTLVAAAILFLHPPLLHTCVARTAGGARLGRTERRRKVRSAVLLHSLRSPCCGRTEGPNRCVAEESISGTRGATVVCCCIPVFALPFYAASNCSQSPEQSQLLQFTAPHAVDTVAAVSSAQLTVVSLCAHVRV